MKELKCPNRGNAFVVDKDVPNGIPAEASGKKTEDVAHDTDRDFFMSAQEAKSWGIADRVQ